MSKLTRQHPHIVARSALVRIVAVAALTLSLGACETASKLGTGLDNMADKGLEVIGFKKPELPPVPESAMPPRKMNLQLVSSSSLNTESSGQSLSLVVRVYKLKATTAFLNAPFETFGDPAKEKAALGAELIESKEVVLLPGQKRAINEKWAREAPFVGVVGLFMTPASERWRYAFELDSLLGDDPIVLGAHACTLSVAKGKPVGVSKEVLALPVPTCHGKRHSQPAKAAL